MPKRMKSTTDQSALPKDEQDLIMTEKQRLGGKD
jgi:hypothetical protein